MPLLLGPSGEDPPTNQEAVTMRTNRIDLTDRPLRAGAMLTTALLALTLLVTGFSGAALADHDGTDHDDRDPSELECKLDPSFAEIVNLHNSQLTIQVAGNQAQLDLPREQAFLVSLDGGFYVDIDYHCLERMTIDVYKDGTHVHHNGVTPGCGSGTHTEFVPVGLEFGTYEIVVEWWGCDGTTGIDSLVITVFDPPVFSPEAAEE